MKGFEIMAIFTNQATLTYNGNSVNSNIVTGNIVEVLTITKTAIDGSFTSGDEVTYIVSITNSGAVPFTDVTVTDNLGAYSFNTSVLIPLDYIADSVVYYQNGVLQATPTVTSTEPLTVTGITIPAGGNAILVYQTRTNGFAPLSADATITNMVTATAPGITTPVTAEETITASARPELTITKSLSPTNVTENSQITYTFTIQNFGNTPAVAEDNVIITDEFNPIISGITVTVDSDVFPAGGYTYNEATGEFATVAGFITVPAATFTQNPTTGEITVIPGATTVTVTGII